MEAGINKSSDQVSPQSTAGMGDIGLLNVIAMSPDMSAAASSSFSSHRFTTPRTVPSNKNHSINPPPIFSTGGQQHTSPQPSYTQVGQCVVSTQQHVLTSNSSSPAVAHTTAAGSQYRPHRPASTPSNSVVQSKNGCGHQNAVNSNQNIVTQANNVRPGYKRVHNSLSPTSQTPSPGPPTSQHFPSPSSQNFMYKLSKTPTSRTANEISCNSPLLGSPISGGATTLAALDLNREQSQPLLYVQHDGLNRGMATVYVTTTQESTGSLADTGTSVSAPGFPGSSSSPDLSPQDRASPPEDSGGGRTYSNCSTPSTPHEAGSINPCPSPQVSDLSSEETSLSAPQLNFAQSYANLTPWTSKLTMPGYVPLPRPAPDALPIPLQSINKEYMLAMSPTSVEMPTQPHHPRPYQLYSRLQPGMAGGGGFNANVPNGKTVKNGTLHTQKGNFKILPNREHRFKRTADALQKSGLWEVAMKTGNLMKRNRELQRELEQFRADALTFLKSVIKNPQNRDFIKNVLNNALASNSAPRNGTSVMTVVVSAAAAAAAASVRLDSNGSTDDSMSSSNNST